MRGTSTVLAVLLVSFGPLVSPGPARAQGPPPKPAGSPASRPATARAAAPSAQVPSGWKMETLQTSIRLSRKAEEAEPSPIYGEAPGRATLAVQCNDKGVELSLEPTLSVNLPPQRTGQDKALVRLDADKASDEPISGFGTSFTFRNGPDLVKQLPVHDWMLVRYASGDGYKENSFNLQGLDAVLPVFTTACKLPAGFFAQAAEPRPAPRRAPARSGTVKTVSARWAIATESDRFDDSRKVVMTLPSRQAVASQSAPDAGRLLVRSLARKVEVYLVMPGMLDDTDRTAIRFDDGPPRTYSTSSSTDYKGLFLPNPTEFVKELARHRRMTVALKLYKQTQTRDVVFDLDGFEKGAAPLLDAAGLPATVLAEAPKPGKWEDGEAEPPSAILRLASEPQPSGKTVHLILRCQGGTLDAYVTAPRGADKEILVGYDDVPPKAMAMSGSSSYVRSGDAFFFPAAWDTVANLLGHQRMTIAFPKAPDYNVTFDVSSLEAWVSPLRKGCNAK